MADLLDAGRRATSAADPDGRWDVISGLAFPLPFAVISEMLGMPDSTDTAQLREWSHTLVQVLDPILAATNTEAIYEAGDHMIEVITDAIAWKRGRLDQDDDLLAALIRAEDDGDMLTEVELRDNVMLLFMAGHETTVNLIGNGTNALLRNRDQLERLRGRPGARRQPRSRSCSATTARSRSPGGSCCSRSRSPDTPSSAATS